MLAVYLLRDQTVLEIIRTTRGCTDKKMEIILVLVVSHDIWMPKLVAV